MTIEVIPAGRGIQIATSALYMSILDASGAFVIKNPKIGELAGKIGRQFVLEGIEGVEFLNKSSDDVTVEYETANIRIYGSGSGGVNIDNAPSIQRIIEPIDFEASVTFDSGTVAALSPQVFDAKLHVAIPAKSAGRLIIASSKNSRKINLQVISEEDTTLFLGSTSAISADSGLILRGSIAAIGSGTIETETELWAWNDSTTEAKIAIVEQYRN